MDPRKLKHSEIKLFKKRLSNNKPPRHGLVDDMKYLAASTPLFWPLLLALGGVFTLSFYTGFFEGVDHALIKTLKIDDCLNSTFLIYPLVMMCFQVAFAFALAAKHTNHSKTILVTSLRKFIVGILSNTLKLCGIIDLLNKLLRIRKIEDKNISEFQRIAVTGYCILFLFLSTPHIIHYSSNGLWNGIFLPTLKEFVPALVAIFFLYIGLQNIAQAPLEPHYKRGYCVLAAFFFTMYIPYTSGYTNAHDLLQRSYSGSNQSPDIKRLHTEYKTFTNLKEVITTSDKLIVIELDSKAPKNKFTVINKHDVIFTEYNTD